jgi:hypothetical protein
MGGTPAYAHPDLFMRSPTVTTVVDYFALAVTIAEIGSGTTVYRNRRDVEDNGTWFEDIEWYENMDHMDSVGLSLIYDLVDDPYERREYYMELIDEYGGKLDLSLFPERWCRERLLSGAIQALDGAFMAALRQAEYEYQTQIYMFTLPIQDRSQPIAIAQPQQPIAIEPPQAQLPTQMPTWTSWGERDLESGATNYPPPSPHVVESYSALLEPTPPQATNADVSLDCLGEFPKPPNPVLAYVDLVAEEMNEDFDLDAEFERDYALNPEAYENAIRAVHTPMH